MADAETGTARPERWRTIVRSAGEILVSGGLVLLLFVVYEVFVTDWVTAQRQDELSEQLHAEWAAADPTGTSVDRRGDVGDAFAILHVPRFGPDYAQVVLEGTTEATLRQGPGHYVGSAMPGEPGNVALAGHRVGKGAPFLDLDTMRPGDAIVVETADSWFVYRVLGDPATGDFTTDPSGIPGQRIVRPADVEVIAPTPGGDDDAAPIGSYLTLTTCHPKFSARERLIIHAELDGPGLSKADHPGGPPALTED